MTPIALRTAVALAWLLPLAAQAGEHCTHSAPRSLQLDLAGVRTLQLETAQHTLRLDGRAGSAHAITGRACAARADWLPQLTLTQERRGDTLIVRAKRDGQASGFSLGDTHAYLDLSGSVPEGVAVRLSMGSGDVLLAGIASLDATVGSGDLDARNVRGPVKAGVGSGDIVIDGATRLDVGSIGSGDLTARNIAGAVDVGSIGSGDFKLAGARGDVKVGTLGSGDATLSAVTGSVNVGSIGSGDLKVTDVGGKLTVRAVGSGDVEHRDIRGGTDLPRKH